MKILNINNSIVALIVQTSILSTPLFSADTTENQFSKNVRETGKKIENSVDKEKIKDKAYSMIDSIDSKKVNEVVDQAAEYFDPRKMKASVDQIAEYIDKERIREFINLAIDNLDKEKIKAWIDSASELLDKEKIKEGLGAAVDSIDKEQIKRKVGQTVDQAAESLNRAVDLVTNEVSKNGGNFQEMLKDSNWRKLIPTQATSGALTLSDLRLNGQKGVAVVRPGERIKGEVNCIVNRADCSSLCRYQVVVGIKNQNDPTNVYSHFGFYAQDEATSFELKAPQQRGVYRVAFQVDKATFESTALKNWNSKNFETPTIGLIIVN